MYKAKVSDCYIGDGAVFYLLSEKMDMAPIVEHRLNKNETLEQVKERRHIETHWLADWGSTKPVEGYRKGCTVSFNITSSTFYDTMRHDGEPLYNIRNINISNLKFIN